MQALPGLANQQRIRRKERHLGVIGDLGHPCRIQVVCPDAARSVMVENLPFSLEFHRPSQCIADGATDHAAPNPVPRKLLSRHVNRSR